MNFENWLNKTENGKTILEQAQEELVYSRYVDDNSFWQTILAWLRLAHSTGYNSSQNLSNE